MAFFIGNFMMLAFQSVTLRMFILVTRVRKYVLASVILALCGIGVFSLHNIEFDLWTLFWFGLIGFFMRQFGFPLAPMILGVVLGNIAEINLARAMAISSDLSIFLTRPWSLLFLLIAFFSIIFPYFRYKRGKTKWALFFLPAALFSISVPLMMMGGIPRPTIAVCLTLIGLWLLYKRGKAGWDPAQLAVMKQEISEGN
jgi:putative tricarboxylic transport membrane protein